MCPYKGESFEVYSKSFPFNPYTVNKVYLNPYGVYVFVNQKGYLHVLMYRKALIPHYKGDYAWQIVEFMLTTSNTLKEVNSSCFYKTEDECRQAMLNYTGVDN